MRWSYRWTFTHFRPRNLFCVPCLLFPSNLRTYTLNYFNQLHLLPGLTVMCRWWTSCQIGSLVVILASESEFWGPSEICVLYHLSLPVWPRLDYWSSCADFASSPFGVIECNNALTCSYYVLWFCDLSVICFVNIEFLACFLRFTCRKKNIFFFI